ncbi:MAG: DUF354 domain-containing protein [Terriglobia bacterium]
MANPSPTSVTPVKTPFLSSVRKNIWIDLDNSPHVPFFVPIIRELEALGYSVVLTARDAYQVCDLADLFRLNYRCIGRHYGKYRVLKLVGACARVVQLMPLVLKAKPSLAIAHGSRSQVLTSALLGIPCLQIADYEHGASSIFANPRWVMVPDVIPASSLRADAYKVLTYPGIKEDVYVPGFVPDPSILVLLGVEENALVVTVRPPANEAHYHNSASDDLFRAVIELLAKTPVTNIILLPRNGKQARSAREYWPELFAEGKIIIPDHAVDGLNLIWHSDLVISGGGTMNREAAALGVPVYSIFRGTIGAVDRYLAARGRLVMVETVDEVRTKILLKRRPRSHVAKNFNSAALTAIVDRIVGIMEGSEQGVPGSHCKPVAVPNRGANG